MPASQIRNRIIAFELIPAAVLTPHELNPRRHPDAQRRALTNALERHGWNDAVKVFLTGTRNPGSAQKTWTTARAKGEYPALTIFDGHLRQDLAADADVPVLVTDLTTREARESMLAHDPIGSMAEFDASALDKLMASARWKNPPLQTHLSEILKTWSPPGGEATPPAPKRRDPAPEVFDVLIHAGTSERQAEIFDRLVAEGLDVEKVS